jgi:hypothetical protein
MGIHKWHHLPRFISLNEKDGTLNEDDFTGTGFPVNFYSLKYHPISSTSPQLRCGRYPENAPRISIRLRLESDAAAPNLCSIKRDDCIAKQHDIASRSE